MTRAFPAEGLLAKKETQATLLHAKGILGQGTRVAILDTVRIPSSASPFWTLRFQLIHAIHPNRASIQQLQA